MAASRAVADAGSVTPALYKSSHEGISKLLHELRGGPSAAKGAARHEPFCKTRGAAKDAERPPCAARTRSPPQQKRQRGAKEPHRDAEPGFSESDEDEEDEESDSWNDDRCHGCSQGGELICCESCCRSWHVMCLPSDAMDPSGDDDDWKCPVCTRSTQPLSTANPKMVRGKGRPKQKRYKSAHEAPKGANKKKG